MTMRALVTLVLLGVAGAPAAAHGLRLEAELVPPAVVVEARYEGGTPIPDASLRVYEPGGESGIFQRAHTDAEGRFAFAPSRAGSWRVVVADSEGHRANLEVEIDEAFLTRSTESGGHASSLPLLARWVVGLSIIFGVTGLAFWGKARALLRERGARGVSP
jgi:hypothetical protein